MTDAIIVAIIGSSAGLLGTIVTVWKRSRDGNQNPKTLQEGQPSTSASTSALLLTASPAAVSERSVCRLAHEQISDAIEAVPPFQRGGVTQSFIGATVCWTGPLVNIWKHDTNLHVSLSLGDHSGLIFCYAKPEHCEGLHFAPEGHPVQVIGEIADISKHEAHLVNCRIRALAGEYPSPPKLALGHS